MGAEMAEALRFDPMIRFEGPIDSLVEENLAEDVLAVAHEALANAARHAGSRVELTLTVTRGRLTLVVLDDGGGTGEVQAGRGLTNMRARAEAIGGECTLGPRAGGGTVLRWSVPLGD